MDASQIKSLGTARELLWDGRIRKAGKAALTLLARFPQSALC